VPTKNRYAVEWLLRNAKARTVGKTRFVYRGIEVSVSTVFLVLNHAHFGGPPILWETMIFTKNQFLDGYQERYTGRQAAEAGHALAVMMAQKTLRERRLPSPRRIAVAERRMQRSEDVLRRPGRRRNRYGFTRDERTLLKHAVAQSMLEQGQCHIKVDDNGILATINGTPWKTMLQEMQGGAR
jgi:hypothetical protein